MHHSGCRIPALHFFKKSIRGRTEISRQHWRVFVQGQNPQSRMFRPGAPGGVINSLNERRKK